MNLKLLCYNNYYNRIVKKPTIYKIGQPYGLTDYESYLLGEVVKANFNPNDGVDANHVINYTGAVPDYIVVTEEVNQVEVINSRWFVIEATRTRNGQFALVLRRDLAVDYYDEIADSTAFIEKAKLDASDPAIFNSENMTFNQIKEDETLLKDSTGTAWMVGYLNPKYEAGAGTFNIDVEVPVDGAEEVAYIEDLPYINDNTLPFYPRPFVEYKIPIIVNISGSIYGGYYITIDEEGIAYTDGIPTTFDITDYRKALYLSGFTIGYALERINAIINAINNGGALGYITNLNSDISGEDPHIKTDYEINDLRSNDQKIFKVIEPNYYTQAEIKFSFNRVPERTITAASSMALHAQALLDYIKTLDSRLEDGDISQSPKSLTYKYKYKVPQYDIEYNVYNNSLSGSMNLATIPTLNDAPYKMFCIPYNNYTLDIGSTTLHLQGVASNIVGYNLATIIGSNLYDIQLLPYCPLREYLDSTGKLVLPEGYPITEIKDNNNTVTAIIPCVSSNFSFDISYSVPIADVKVQSECDMYRLCSPNYSGIFEFNAAKNGGVSRINVDCTYKPYSPYIHLNPDFKLLYGADYNDQRGLICGGDFSLPVLNDAWIQYQIANKNYNNSFNRTIENMEIKNKVGLLSDIVNATTGVGQGAAAGAIAGGGVGGAVAGGILSAVGGAADIAINQQLRKEEIDYTKDQFGYTLGNIKAQPQTLAKISSIDFNSKFYPFIEFYTCTDIEKEALRQKIKWNGMTVMRIGRFGNFIKPEFNYIKAKLIKIDIQDDFHLTNSIAEELDKGLRYGGEE